MILTGPFQLEIFYDSVVLAIDNLDLKPTAPHWKMVFVIKV